MSMYALIAKSGVAKIMNVSAPAAFRRDTCEATSVSVGS